jgi:hypothetical protein
VLTGPSASGRRRTRYAARWIVENWTCMRMDILRMVHGTTVGRIIDSVSMRLVLLTFVDPRPPTRSRVLCLLCIEAPTSSRWIPPCGVVAVRN